LPIWHADRRGTSIFASNAYIQANPEVIKIYCSQLEGLGFAIDNPEKLTVS
jgi:hypothetical protein